MSIKTKQVEGKPLSVLVEGCFSLSISFHLVAGKKKLKPEEIGLNAIDIPQKAISLGSKQVAPKETIAELNAIKSDLLGYLETIGFKIQGVWNIPLDKYEEVKAYIDEVEERFIELKRYIIINIQKITREWAEEVDAIAPGMGKAILTNSYSPEYLANKVQFEHVFWENAQDVAALSLFKDVSKTAKDQLDEILGGKNKCTKSSCLDRILGIKKKLAALRFVHENVSLIIQRIDRFILTCPQKGDMPKNFAENLAVELAFLSNPEHLLQLGHFQVSEDADDDDANLTIKERLTKPNAELEALLNQHRVDDHDDLGTALPAQSEVKSSDSDVPKTTPKPSDNPQAELDLFFVC